MEKPGQTSSKKNALDMAKHIELLEHNTLDLERELLDNYYNLGKSVYEIAEQRIAEINKLVDNLVDTKRRLINCREQRICLNCMHINQTTNLYCGHCGKLLEQTNEEELK